MKTAGNKKCADCGEQCAVNVDTTHGVFVCTSCSGIHREFGDRIKSVSMASFTKEDIALLSSQTNDSFNEVWMAKWKGEVPLPLSADDIKRRAFLTAKYQEKRWYSRRVAGARISFTPSRPRPIQNTPPLAPPPKGIDIVDDLLDFNTPISPQHESTQTSKNSLLDLSQLIKNPPSGPTLEFPPSNDILRSAPKSAPQSIKSTRDLMALW
jgi:hypothetical protein